MLDHFRFVKERTRQTPKMTIPSPSSLHFRYGRAAVPEAMTRSGVGTSPHGRRTA
jgi:5-methyltetrahydropteroyltriglutamate--homocysteine methyltransferase